MDNATTLDQILGITSDWRNSNGAQWLVVRDTSGYHVQVRVPTGWVHDSLEIVRGASSTFACHTSQWWHSDSHNNIEDALAVATRQAHIIRNAQQQEKVA